MTDQDLSNDLTVYVLPVSGGHFVSQLGEICCLSEQEFDPPDIVFGASGGNLAAYIASSGFWRKNPILSNCSDISNDHFLTPWIKMIPAWLSFPYFGSLYKKSIIGVDLFRKWFTPKTIVKTEIWTLAFDEDEYRGQLFCNRSRETSCLHVSGPTIYGCTDDVIYSNGNVDQIYNSTYASAAMQLIAEPLKMGKNRYSDGGIMYASPLTPLTFSLVNTVKKEGKFLRLFYFSPYNINSHIPPKMSIYNKSLGAILHSSQIQDHAEAVSLLRHFGAHDLKMTKYKTIDNISSILPKNKHCIIFIIPKNNEEADYVNFTSENIKTLIMENMTSGFEVEVWEADVD